MLQERCWGNDENESPSKFKAFGGEMRRNRWKRKKSRERVKVKEIGGWGKILRVRWWKKALIGWEVMGKTAKVDEREESLKEWKGILR